MAQKILLFNYFLQKVAETKKKQLETDDFKVALLSIIFSKANIFRRGMSGCSSQTVWSCHTQYAEDLFWLVCLDAKAHGEDLLHYYHPRASFLFGGERQWGTPILEDVDLQAQCVRIYPKAMPEQELYAKVAKQSPLPQILKSTAVDTSKLELPEPSVDTAAIDHALARLWQDVEFTKLLEIESKFDFYGKSLAHKYYATHYAALIPTV